MTTVASAGAYLLSTPVELGPNAGLHRRRGHRHGPQPPHPTPRRPVPGKGTGSPAPSPQTRTSAMNASGSSVTTSLRQWRTKQATPRLAHNCADPGPAILWSFMDTVGEPGVSPIGPPRETLCPALPVG